jgi:chemotaxis protein MotB
MRGDLDALAGVESGSPELGDRMQTLFDRRGLVIRLSAKDFFARGEASVRSDLQPLLDRIGRIVAASGRGVRIEGHTDPTEVSASGPAAPSAQHRPFASGWELSAARAGWVARYWITRFELDPARVAVTGYSHYRPLPTQEGAASEWALSQNRRVEIIVEADAQSEAHSAPKARH